MTRLIVLAIVIALLANLVRAILRFSKNTTCTHCDGKGFWRETRGDKVHCKACDGRGYIPKR